MQEVMHTKSRFTGDQGRDITVEFMQDGFRVWYGEEFWTTVSTLFELAAEIEDLCQYGAMTIDKSEMIR